MTKRVCETLRMKTSKHLKTIETALDRVLTELIEIRALEPVSPVKGRFVQELTRELLPTRLQSDARALAKSPVPAALKQAVRTLGNVAFEEVGSVLAMRALAERVCALDQGNYGRRIAIADSAWNGIGSGEYRWWS
jgi:hypothetical protein